MRDHTRSAEARAGARGYRHRLHEVIFEADTRAGQVFDVVLLVLIILSIVAVTLESVDSINQEYGPALRFAEWMFTIFFTIEYILRLVSVRKPLSYATSFFGVIDLLAVIPTYLSLLFPTSQAFVAIRALRLLRVFRIFKLARYVSEINVMLAALRATRAKITVFLFIILAAVLIMGCALYVVEGNSNSEQFSSIPRSVYWAIVTITTVGYGDIAPVTNLGRFLAATAMLLGYSLIIIPTGVFSAELVKAAKPVSTQSCPDCAREGHDTDAAHCKYCGGEL